MDLALFFEPLPQALVAEVKDQEAFIHSIHPYTDNLPDLGQMKIALLGVPEGRGARENEGTLNAPNEIRKPLYRLKKGHGAYKIVDLGNLKPGVDREETVLKVREVCGFLLRSGILPVILGGAQDLTLGQYQAYEDLEKLVSIVNVDASFDMEKGEEVAENKKFLQTIFTYEPNFLFHYSHMGHQSYLVHPDTLTTIETLFFEAYRLGQLRDHPRDMEPVIRQGDMLTFDIGSIRWADAPGHAEAQPFGLTGEEACQIAWYAGINEKLSSAGFYEYNPQFDDDRRRTAKVVATMVWYFIEGFHHRRDKLNFTTNDYLKYVVSMPSEPEVLVFYKSKLSEKWWMEVPHPQYRGQYNRHIVVPCSYSDYERANHGELPERWVQTQAKIV
ncbi:MAG TPA: formiminoglutamase [Cytophagales bacterium]|nr:formiminoglutamase [Cytophagales bacterium]HAA18709.1 formiminoglutamase [Cytophagales bacterium]HAP61564.1 formiminoglutamase [Cytophagales bacterium]